MLRTDYEERNTIGDEGRSGFPKNVGVFQEISRNEGGGALLGDLQVTAAD
jgi:hypothetical protein